MYWQEKEAKKEAFRKYLESSGVLDALTKVLGSLLDISLCIVAQSSTCVCDQFLSDRFVQQKLGGPSLSEYEKLQAELSELQMKYNQLFAAYQETSAEDVQTLAREAAETVVLVIDEEGVEYLTSELLRAVSDSQASIRRSSAYLMAISSKTVSWEALSRVVSFTVPKEILPSYIKLVLDAAVDFQRIRSVGKEDDFSAKSVNPMVYVLTLQGGPILIPGLCYQKHFNHCFQIFLQGLISGSAELREQAALGLGELIEVTSEKALKEFAIPITGPLIRIIGDRFPWQVKSAILSTLTIIIRKGGMALKPFLPQLQTTFVKCLQDNTRVVRSSAALALGKLSALSTRVDPLVGDLLSSLQALDSGVREASLSALEGVLKHAGKSVSTAVRTRVYLQLKDLIHHDDDQVRISAASILGIMSQYVEDTQLTELLQELSNFPSSLSWSARHGSVLTISSMLRHIPSTICTSPVFPSILDQLKGALTDEKFPLRETSTKAFGRLLVYKVRSDPSNTSVQLDIISSLVSALHDDSSEVRRKALSALKAVSKESSSPIVAHINIIGPALAECLKDGSTPVRLAAERCALHAFQLTKGTENVQAAQKFITGLDARRISKFPEHSDDSEDGEDDSASG
ncbi:hypothetical protein M0R45_028084 [Rubus argutus]|uniref:Maestro/Maestro-like HEAT-repeats domain-containing protein n=1 Tax=Rubus argutus TaxID=59490 RepID=A0AAW1W4K8_RUBAR